MTHRGMPPKRSPTSSPARRTRSIEAFPGEAFPGEATPFPGETRELLSSWEAAMAKDEMGAETTSPTPATTPPISGPPPRGPPLGAQLCDLLLFGTRCPSGGSPPPAQATFASAEAPSPWTGMGGGDDGLRAAPQTSATTGKVWDERRQRFVTTKPTGGTTAAARGQAKPKPPTFADTRTDVRRGTTATVRTASHLKEHVDNCTAEQAKLGGSAQGIGEHVAEHQSKLVSDLR